MASNYHGLIHSSTHKPSTYINIMFYTILFLIVYQSLHMTDHLLQYYERYVLKMSPPPGLFEGLFNASDTTVHLWLNGIEYVVILIIAISFFKSFRFIKMNQHRPYSLLILQYTIIFLAIYQSLHVIDHIFQYYQLYVLKMSSPPALFEGAFNESDTIIHAWINGILIVSSFTIWIAFSRSKLRKKMKQDLLRKKL